MDNDTPIYSLTPIILYQKFSALFFTVIHQIILYVHIITINGPFRSPNFCYFNPLVTLDFIKPEGMPKFR